MIPKVVLAPAKINIFLNVIKQRNDGYHDLYTGICSVSLYDLLIFSFNKRKKNSVLCNHPGILDNKLNLVNKAIRLFFNKMYKIGLKTDSGVSVFIRKKIPVGAGFGGGSSNAASTLLFLNASFGYPFSKKALMNIGRKIGADVPFFIFGSPAIARGIGDHLEIFRHKLPSFALLVYTGIVVNTGWVYENLYLNENLRLTKEKKKLSNVYLDIGNSDHEYYLVNDLESVTEVRYPVISEVKNLLLELGATGVLMSGSGSGVFGLYDRMEDVILAQKFLFQYQQSKGWSSYAVSLLF